MPRLDQTLNCRGFMPEIYDHQGRAVTHHRARVNGIRMHYVTAGKGEPLLLLHGTPKTHYYWYRLIPLLSAHFSIIAPDLRGFGDTDKPDAEEGYDSLTNARDLYELMTMLEHDRYFIHGEDRGAEYGYVMAAVYRDKVRALSFCEMLLSGDLLEKHSAFTRENASRRFKQDGVWLWHIPFLWLADIPEMLISGKEREFWEFFMKQETWNPAAFEPEAMDEWIGFLKAPGGLKGVLNTYRATMRNGEINNRLRNEKLSVPVMGIGGREFMGAHVSRQIALCVSNTVRSVVFEECGHSLALEAPEKLAEELKQFFINSVSQQ